MHQFCPHSWPRLTISIFAGGSVDRDGEIEFLEDITNFELEVGQSLRVRFSSRLGLQTNAALVAYDGHDVAVSSKLTASYSAVDLTHHYRAF